MLLLHGDNTEQSRLYLNGKIKNFKGEVVKLEGEKITLTDLKQALESFSLFGKERLVIIFNFFSAREKKEKEKILNYCLKENPANLIFWEGRRIRPEVIKKLKVMKIEEFKFSLIFNFLDSLSPLRKNSSFNLLHQCLKKETPEKVFNMLRRHFEQLIIALDLGAKGLKEYPPWKQKKLINQAKLFGMEKLIKIYDYLLEIDYQQKTGKTILPLEHQLDFLIMKI